MTEEITALLRRVAAARCPTDLELEMACVLEAIDAPETPHRTLEEIVEQARGGGTDP